MLKKREIFIAVSAFFLGALGMYFITRSTIAENKKTTSRIVNNCFQALSASQDMISSCSSAYKEITLCFQDIQTCNLDDSAHRLGVFNEKKETAERKVKTAISDVDFIISTLER